MIALRNRFKTLLLAFLTVVSYIACSDSTDPANVEAGDTPTIERYSHTNNAFLANIHPAEQRLYAFISAYIMRMDAALAEPDDNKAIAKLKTVKSEMAIQARSVQAELNPWLRSLDGLERKAFHLRMMEQESISKAFQLLHDPRLALRLKKNPILRQTFEKVNKGPSEVWLPNKTQEPGNINGSY